MYEHKLKELNPTAQHITYDISDLHNFLDSLCDIVALLFDYRTIAFVTQDRDWIKGKVFRHLSEQAR